MTDLFTIRDAIADRLARDDLSTQIDRCVNNAVAHYNRLGGDHLQRAEGAITTVASQQWYATIDFTGGFGAQDHASATEVRDVVLFEHVKVSPGSSGYDDSIRRVSFEHMEELSNGEDTGAWPEFYAVHAGRIGLWPIPSAVMTVEVAAMVRSPSVSGSETNAFITAYPELVEMAALKRVCAEYLHDLEMSAVYRAREEEVWEPVAADMIRRIGSRRLRGSL